MFNGRLLGIVATTALELGIDIGSLDAVITVGFPYSLPGLVSFHGIYFHLDPGGDSQLVWKQRQQAGRAGRRNKDSLAMLICDPFPFDQHFARNPDELFSKPQATLNLDLENELILEAHIQCAAHEIPIYLSDDEGYFGTKLAQICKERLVVDEESFYHCHPRLRPNPARHVSIRNIEDENYAIVDTTSGKYAVLEEIEWSRAVFEVFEGSVFMHQGQTFLVREINHDARIAKLEKVNIDWTTRCR
jgi:DEAD/DEAH box helicase domain-containing protein